MRTTLVAILLLALAAPAADFEYQRRRPNAQHVIAIIGDGPDPDRVCDWFTRPRGPK